MPFILILGLDLKRAVKSSYSEAQTVTAGDSIRGPLLFYSMYDTCGFGSATITSICELELKFLINS